MIRNRLVMIAAGLLLGACGLLPLEFGVDDAPALLVPVVLESYPHDPNAFTQGLLIEDGRLYESTGLYGRSTLREVDLTTGEVLRSVSLEPSYFAEGLALVGDRLIQLTWREGTAFVYDAATFERVDSFSYDTEGWGLCYDGESLYMSDGSATLFRRDPQTFALLDQFTVTRDGQPVVNLNELECVGHDVYANVWYSDEIMRIDKRTGLVNAVIDASALLPPDERDTFSGDAVLNGIAYDAERDLFLLTGKLWPRLFAVRFEAVEG